MSASQRPTAKSTHKTATTLKESRAEIGALGRLSGHIIEQSHYFPVFPPLAKEDLPKPTGIPDEVPAPGGEERLAVGANLDLEYLKLGDFWQARPDMLILPSVLSPFAKVSQTSVH